MAKKGCPSGTILRNGRCVQKRKKITKKYLEDNFLFEKASRTKDGTFKLYQGYFYRHGMTSDKWGGKAIKMLEEQGIKAKLIDTTDSWNAWPKDSYFIAEVKIEE